MEISTVKSILRELLVVDEDILEYFHSMVIDGNIDNETSLIDSLAPFIER